MIECHIESEDLLWPVHVAAKNGNLKELKAFALQSVDNLRTEDEYGRVAAHFAALRGHSNCLLFIAENAPETLTQKDRGPDYQTRLMTPLKRTGPWGGTSAHYACQATKPECLQIIVSNYPDVLKMQDNEGNVPAHYASEIAHRERALGCISTIASIAPETFSTKNNRDMTPAILAAKNNAWDRLKVMVEYCPAVLEDKEAIKRFAVENENSEEFRLIFQ